MQDLEELQEAELDTAPLPKPNPPYMVAGMTALLLIGLGTGLYSASHKATDGASTASFVASSSGPNSSTLPSSPIQTTAKAVVAAAAPSRALEPRTPPVEGTAKLDRQIAIHFDFGSSQPYDHEVQQLVDVIQSGHQPLCRIIHVDGYADSRGSQQSNLLISRDRARRIVSLLERHGLTKDVRFTARWHGAARPVADNRTASGRAANRRVEVTFTRNL